MPNYEIDIAGGKHLLSARPDRLDLRDRIYRPPLRPIQREFPTQEEIEFFLPYYKKMILDQKKEGACTGFGLAAVINYQYWFRDVVLPALAETTQADMSSKLNEKLNAFAAEDNKVSPRMLYQMARLYDDWDGDGYEGSSCRGAMRGWYHHGVCLDCTWPYHMKGRDIPSNWGEDAAKRPLGAYYRIEIKSIADIQAALQEIFAIYVSAKVHSGWDVEQKSDPVPEIEWSANSKPWGGHAFAIVGYNARGFYVQNSWGPDWGHKGFALMTYADWLENGMDAWAVVYGAPLEGVAPSGMHRTGCADRRNSLSTSSVSTTASGSLAKDQKPEWSGSETYQHSIVLGNNGLPLSRLVQAEHGAEHIQIAAEQKVLEWCGAHKDNRNLMIFAHGGLNSEHASMRRVGILGPKFKANGVYPLFITWKTGILETLSNLFHDTAARDAQLPDFKSKPDVTGFLDDLVEKVVEANDYTWEAVASRFVVRAAWSEMKENAALAANKDGGTFLLARHLRTLRERYPDLRVHMVGHSAGSIILGHLIDELCRYDIKTQSLGLFAPACTMDFATSKFGNALKKKVIKRNTTYFELLSDENERDDQVAGVYRKSLLYLISRALEKSHKTPLLGLHSAWDQTPKDYVPDTYLRDEKNRAIQQWHKLWANGPRPVLIKEREVRIAGQASGAGAKYLKATHGSFDNNIDTITRSIRKITGKDPIVPIRDLTGY